MEKALKSAHRVRFRSVTTLLTALFALAAGRWAHATEYPLTGPDDAVVGEDQTIMTVYEDTLYDLARAYSLGSEELIRVNPGVDPWLPGAGKMLVIPGRHILPPGPHEGIVVNLPEHRLYYYPKPKRDGSRVVITYPVSIGKMDWRTPLGAHPRHSEAKGSGLVPARIRAQGACRGRRSAAGKVPPGPANPLGNYAMRLAAGNGTYLIHGTNNPIAVGLAVTHGCIRMYPDDVAAAVSADIRRHAGTPHQRAGEGGVGRRELLLEAHPPSMRKVRALSPNLMNSRNC